MEEVNIFILQAPCQSLLDWQTFGVEVARHESSFEYFFRTLNWKDSTCIRFATECIKLNQKIAKMELNQIIGA